MGNDGQCGYLVDGRRKEWAEKMEKVIKEKSKFNKGKDKMVEKFGLKSFGEQFSRGITEVSK